jgi:hypothetical protein
MDEYCLEGFGTFDGKTAVQVFSQGDKNYIEITLPTITMFFEAEISIVAKMIDYMQERPKNSLVLGSFDGKLVELSHDCDNDRFSIWVNRSNGMNLQIEMDSELYSPLRESLIDLETDLYDLEE